MQQVVDTRREGDKNPLSGVVAETVKLSGNSSMDIRSWIDPGIQSQHI